MTLQLTDLDSTIQNNECVAFFGSGLSTPANYPSWAELIRLLCERCGVDFENNEELFLSLADKAFSNNEAQYRLTLNELFGKLVEIIPINYNSLKEIPFISFVTLNFDPVFMRATAGDGYQYFTHRKGLDISSIHRYKAVFYLHGVITEESAPEDIDVILTESQFEAEYRKEGVLYPFLRSLFDYQNIIFLGCRLSEPALQNILEISREVHQKYKEHGVTPTNTKHIILSHIYKDDGSIDLAREDSENVSYKELGIEVVRYELDAQHRHHELTQFLGRLAKYEAPKVSSPWEQGNLPNA